MSSPIWTAPATRRMQTRDTLCYYVLHTLFPLPGYLDNQHSEFLNLWLDYHGFREFPNLIMYYTTIAVRTKIKEEYTSIENFTPLKDLDNLVYTTHPPEILRGHSQPNPTYVEYANILPYMIS